MTTSDFSLRVNGFEVADAKLLRIWRRPVDVAVVRDKLVGAFAIDDRFELEALDLRIPPAVRERLPNAGWRKVSTRRLTWLIRARDIARRNQFRVLNQRNIPAHDDQPLSTTGRRPTAFFTALNGNAQGYATGVATVAVSPIAAMPEKTLFHEVAHVILGHHTDGSLNSVREVEAECVALICCEVLGPPGPESSRAYVQHWLSGDSIPEKSAARIFQAADRVLKAGTEERCPTSA
jgi:hypothetical protein